MKDKTYKRNDSSFKDRKDHKNLKPRVPKVEREDPKQVKVDFHNDFAWYNKHSDFLESVAQVSSNHSRGTTLGKLIEGNQVPSVSTIYDNEITASSMLLVPTACGLNIRVMQTAQVAFYQFIRAANSGSRNYETADLFMYLFAIKEFISFLGYAKRLLQTCTHYEVNDRTVPGVLLCAEIGTESLDGSELAYYLAQHKYEILARLNSWITQFNTLAIPGNIPLLQKAYWMFNHVYKTDDKLKPTYACYAPALFLEYDATGSEHGGRLVTCKQSVDMRLTESPSAFLAEFFKVGDRLLSAIMVSEDIAIISGDIRKAFGNENLMLVAPMDLEKDVLIIHDAAEIKNQMHNARLWGPAISGIDDGQSYSIEQRSGYIHDNTLVTYSSFSGTGSGLIGPRAPIIDIDADKVDAPTFVEATRLTGAIDTNNRRVYTDFWAAYDVILYYVQDLVEPTGTKIEYMTLSMMSQLSNYTTIQRMLTGNTEYIPLSVYADVPIRITGDGWEDANTGDEWTGEATLVNPIHNVFRTSEEALRNILEATILSELNIPFIKG